MVGEVSSAPPREVHLTPRFASVGVILLLVSLDAFAGRMNVDRRTVRTDETVAIVITLEGESAEDSEVSLAVKNLELEGEPSISAEFSWVNGAVSRRKTLRYMARALERGPAVAGPATVRSNGAVVETIPAIQLNVLDDDIGGTSDPLAILRSLLASNRPPSFIVAVPSKESVYEGEQVVVTWYLYNAANVQRWQIESVPRLEDFWTEELDVKGEKPREGTLGGVVLQRLAVRRVALYPLRAGKFPIGGLRASAQVLTRTSPGGVFEGALSEFRVPSPHASIEVRPLPPGPPVDLIGDVRMQCAPPQQKEGGPVTVAIGLSGRGNLRAAAAPQFAGPIDGLSELQSVSFDVDKNASGAVMRRRWRYVIFPAREGVLQIPPIQLTTFNPANGRRERQQCAGSSLRVVPAQRSATPAGAVASTPPQKPLLDRVKPVLFWAAIVALIGGAAFAAFRLLRRGAGRRSLMTRIHGDGNIRGVRDRLGALLQEKGLSAEVLRREPGERGDAWRALTSLLDGIERDRIPPAEAKEALPERLREFLDTIP